MITASDILNNLQVFGIGIFFGMSIYYIFFVPTNWIADLIAKFVKKYFYRKHKQNWKNENNK